MVTGFFGDAFGFGHSRFVVKDEDLVCDVEIVQVIFRSNTTIVNWSDGTKTVVNCKDENYDPEKGLAMCVVKKFLGNYTKFDEALENAVYDQTLSRKEKKHLNLME